MSKKYVLILHTQCSLNKIIILSMDAFLFFINSYFAINEIKTPTYRTSLTVLPNHKYSNYRKL